MELVLKVKEVQKEWQVPKERQVKQYVLYLLFYKLLLLQGPHGLPGRQGENGQRGPPGKVGLKGLPGKPGEISTDYQSIFKRQRNNEEDVLQFKNIFLLDEFIFSFKVIKPKVMM